MAEINPMLKALEATKKHLTQSNGAMVVIDETGPVGIDLVEKIINVVVTQNQQIAELERQLKAKA